MEELNIINTVLDQQSTVLDLMRELCVSTAKSGETISLQCINHSRQHIRQMRRELGELERLADKTTVLVSVNISEETERDSCPCSHCVLSLYTGELVQER